MNKILLATTALVMTAGVASAEVAISGSAYMGFAYAEDVANTGNSEVTTDADVNINFALSGETDGGLGFGAFTNHIVNDNGAIANDDSGVYISGAFGKLTMGAVSEAGEFGLSDFGDNGIGFDNTAEAFGGDDNGIGHNVNYTGSFGAVTVAASAAIGKKVGVVPAVLGTPDKNEAYGVSAKYNFGDYYVGAGYNVVNLEAASVATDFDAVSVGAGGKFGAIKVDAVYTAANPEVGKDLEAYGVIASYTMDALTLSVGYADNNAPAGANGTAVNGASTAIGASYDLGGGAKLMGAVGEINKRTKAELGIKMSF
ncbi:porin [Pseudogemmobacter sp. W21_MBD1_M6]|uniref:porin n=1 Tax=Pseudogemmobacter sp. W21_MBD1_M6 TaxID=3240271 RepID=UPI003F9EA8C0